MLFDLDGVVTDTAPLHARAWKLLFDEFLRTRSAAAGGWQPPFDLQRDYEQFVDGRPRFQGVRGFLNSRGVTLPYGTPEDPPDKLTVCGLGNKKNEILHELLPRTGVESISSSLAFIREILSIGLKTALVSSSCNARCFLESAGVTPLFTEIVDGVYSSEHDLRGKPDPDIFLEAARLLQVSPPRAVVVEDATSGVQAAQRGGFGLIVGVDQTGHAEELVNSGAHIVVNQLTEITVARNNPGSERQLGILPSAIEHEGEILAAAGSRRFVVFLDYDGTLSPIVDRPELAVLSPNMRETLERLANKYVVAIISGRDLKDVKRRVGVTDIYYAGSHGYRISGPNGFRHTVEMETDYLSVLDQAERNLKKSVANISGAIVERKHLSIAVHYRLVDEDKLHVVEAMVERVLGSHQGLRRTYGKKVFDLQPDIEWDKGRAVLWLLQALELDRTKALPIYIGDDVTDEDAFRELAEIGIGIAVKGSDRTTAARYALENPEEVRKFLEMLVLQ